MKKSVLFLLLSIVVMCSCTNNYSQGERVGVLTKFSSSGLLWKSYEGDLKIAPNIASQGMVGQYEDFYFSVDNDHTIQCVTSIDSIKEFTRLGIPVVLNYQQVKGYNWFKNRGVTSYFVTSVKRAKYK